MKITKLGIVKSKIWIGTCRSCLSEAEANESEMTHISSDQRDGGRFSWEKCPVCEAGAASGYGGMLFYPRTAATQDRQP